MSALHKEPAHTKPLSSVRYFVPNFFTIVRLLLVVPIFMTAQQGHWVWGFWLVLAALVSDFIDGLAAKKLNAQTRLGSYLDPLADFLLASTGVAAIIATGGLPWWTGLLLLLGALVIGYSKFFLPERHALHRLQPKISVPLLFITWTAIVWVYAVHAFGWSWWYVMATVAVLLSAALLKRHRLRAWF